MTAMKKSSAGGARGADGSAPRFFVPESFAAQGTVTVGEDAARHMRVLRLGPGSVVTLLDGQGGRASGTVRAVGKRSATITIERTEAVPAPLAMHALVPIADRERMLWLAEKASELALTSWRPVLWKRSRSVSPRGEGGGFRVPGGLWLEPESIKQYNYSQRSNRQQQQRREQFRQPGKWKPRGE